MRGLLPAGCLSATTVKLESGVSLNNCRVGVERSVVSVGLGVRFQPVANAPSVSNLWQQIPRSSGICIRRRKSFVSHASIAEPRKRPSKTYGLAASLMLEVWRPSVKRYVMQLNQSQPPFTTLDVIPCHASSFHSIRRRAQM